MARLGSLLLISGMAGIGMTSLALVAEAWARANGAGYNVTVPGYGAIYFNAGHSTYDPVLGETIHGNNSWLVNADELCEDMNQPP